MGKKKLKNCLTPTYLGFFTARFSLLPRVENSASKVENLFFPRVGLFVTGIALFRNVISKVYLNLLQQTRLLSTKSPYFRD